MELAKLEKHSVANKHQESREYLASKGAQKGFLATDKA
jgi:hypothetical protein